MEKIRNENGRLFLIKKIPHIKNSGILSKEVFRGKVIVSNSMQIELPIQKKLKICELSLQPTNSLKVLKMTRKNDKKCKSKK
jgi:hypothetical protein